MPDFVLGLGLLSSWFSCCISVLVIVGLCIMFWVVCCLWCSVGGWFVFGCGWAVYCLGFDCCGLHVLCGDGLLFWVVW